MTVADFLRLPMHIRPATDSDLPAILAIYNHEIATGTAIYIDEPQTLAQRAEWFADRLAAGMPVLVLEDEEGVAGFGSYGPFRNFCGYRFCVEHSVYVAEDRRRRGYGKKLLATLIETATAQGFHSMIAVIDADNKRSIKLHTDFGFTHAGLLSQVGYKFGRWLDVVFLQKTLDNRTRPETGIGPD